jgi:hypothetical protein
VPKSTAVAPVNPPPVMVTGVPPLSGPLAGATLVTAGAALAMVVLVEAVPVMAPAVSATFAVTALAAAGSTVRVMTAGAFWSLA